MEEIALDCPYCHQEIYRPLSWFRQPWFTCPHCGGGLAAGQFEQLVNDIDAAIDQHIAEMIAGPPGCGCGGAH